VGHTAVVLDGDPCPCGRRGCWETVATLGWVRRQARHRGLRGARTVDGARLVELAGHDERAARLLTEYAEHLAAGIANLHQVVGAELFILHGDAATAGPSFVALVADAVRQRTTPDVTVEATRLRDATLLGAAGVVLGELLHTVSAA
jgi:predicted NBD/HSP70 family sugar kinase